ncbi:hypothetical protein VTO42DRAFT_7358 [Malbranchea cinnamomea]
MEKSGSGDSRPFPLVVDIDYLPPQNPSPFGDRWAANVHLRYYLGYFLGEGPNSERVRELAGRFKGDLPALYEAPLCVLQDLFGVVPGMNIYGNLHRKSYYALGYFGVSGNIDTILYLFPEADAKKRARLLKSWKLPRPSGKIPRLPPRFPYLETIWEEDPPKRDWTPLPEFYQRRTNTSQKNE